MKNSNMIEISTGLEPNFLQDILTKDISTLDALYDLVDNSIDAARNSIIRNGNYEKDVMGLPKSYEGYKVHIDISPESICIEDNCFGMQKETLANDAFHIARQSQHQYGIGQYGIGLKRSLLKWENNTIVLLTMADNVMNLIFPNTVLTVRKIKIPAKEEASRGDIKTRLTVTRIYSEIQGEIGNRRWLEKRP